MTIDKHLNIPFEDNVISHSLENHNICNNACVLFNFIWPRRDRIKCNTLVTQYSYEGLNMFFTRLLFYSYDSLLKDY